MSEPIWPVASQQDWHQQLKFSIKRQHLLRARLMLYLVFLAVVALLFWASWAELDQITRGQGKAVPNSQRQIIQTFDGGAVAEILVREGELVETGQLLVRIDATRARASFRETQAESYAIRARIARLTALVNETELIFDAQLSEAAPNLLIQEQQVLQSARLELQERRNIAEQQLRQRQQEAVETQARIQQLTRTISSLGNELSILRPLFDSGAVAELDLLRLERDLNSQQGELSQTRARAQRIQAAIAEAEATLNELSANARNRWQQELADNQNRLSALTESLEGLEDRVRFTDVRSPTRGIVQRLYVNARGSIVQPGRELLEITPLDDQLLFEVQVAPQDIAFIHLDQRANIKVTAFDFAIYGGLEGKVTHISPDTNTDDKGNSFYLVRVATLAESQNPNIVVIPGMTAQIDIITGRHSILEYLLKPINRAMQGALRER